MARQNDGGCRSVSGMRDKWWAEWSPSARSELLKVGATTTPNADYERARRSGGAIRQLVAELRPENDAIQIDDDGVPDDDADDPERAARTRVEQRLGQWPLSNRSRSAHSRR
jgi:hypothetical protein